MILYKGEISNGGKARKTAKSLSLNLLEGTGSGGQVQRLPFSRNTHHLENGKVSG